MIFKNISVKIYLSLAACLVLSGIFTATPSQPNIRSESEQPAPAGEKSAAGNYKTYEALALPDSRFSVKNVNFVRRYDGGGLGEFLDVVFELNNNTLEDINFYVFVLAFYETDSIVKTAGNFAPYPKWRLYDPDSQNYLTHFIRISPADIGDEKIWNKDDPDYIRYRKIHNRISNHVTTLNEVPVFHPPYWKYLAYISNNKTEGLPVKLFGPVSPKPEESIFTNYIPPTPEQVKKKMHPEIIKHTYTVNYSKRKTFVQTHHHSPFRPNYTFFNRAAIVIFDADKIKQAEEQGKRQLEPGEERIEPMVFKKTVILPVLKNI